MRLCVKGTALEPLVLAFAHHPLHILLCQFQVAEQNPLKLVAPVGTLGHLAHPFQWQGHVAFEDFLAKGLRTAEAAVGKLLDFAHAQSFATERQHKLLDLFPAHSVQTHKLAQQAHVGINRKGPGEEFKPHLLAHLGEESQAHAHPGLSATLSWRRFLSSAMKAACSRMLSDRLLEIFNRPRIAAPSSCPSEL
jgi:hypothetical protein